MITNVKETKTCDECGYTESRIIDVRYSNGLTRRKHECKKCKFRWFTIELKEDDYEQLMIDDEKAAAIALERLNKLYSVEKVVQNT